MSGYQSPNIALAGTLREAVAEMKQRLEKSLQHLDHIEGDFRFDEMPQTLLALFGQGSAEFLYSVGSLQDDRAVRTGFEIIGMTNAVGPYLHGLRTVVSPLLYVPSARRRPCSIPPADKPVAA